MSKVLIIGGVAGGASALARLRRLDEKAEIILFERGEFVSYANCGLPYYVGGVIQERDALFLKTPENMAAEFNADVRASSEVTAVNVTDKTVTVCGAQQGEYAETYDYLILAPGAKPILPPFEAIGDERVAGIRTVHDADKAYALARRPGVKSAVVIGGGFIGVEMAENLRHLGLKVSLVEMAPHILAPLDDDMARFAEKEMQKHGVELYLNSKAQRLYGGKDSLRVELAGGTTLAADMAVIALGVRPDTAFLQNSGLELGPAGHILVNEKMQTSAENVYAVGDAAALASLPAYCPPNSPLAVPLAGPANRQGRIAADNICGREARYAGFTATSIVKVFDLAAAATGLNERALKKSGISYQAAVVHPPDHAGYYPGSKGMSLKLLFADDGRILGAQGVGTAGVDKRIDVLATALRLGGKASDLADLELAYAPPFSSAKDPVNMLGFVAANMLSGLFRAISYEEYCETWKGKKKHVLLDVRTAEEFDKISIKGSVNIPLDALRARLGELPKNVPVITTCLVGKRSYQAYRTLVQNGYDALALRGGGTSVWGRDAEDPLCCGPCPVKK